MKMEKFEGHSIEMKEDSPWLTAEDLKGKRPILTIEEVNKAKDVVFEGGRKYDKKFCIKFKDVPKQMIVNAGVRKAMVAMYGLSVKDWVGKKVKLGTRKVRNPQLGMIVDGLMVFKPEGK